MRYHLFFIIIAGFFLASCGATRNKMTLAEKCATQYPCRDTTIFVDRVHTDTLIIPGLDQVDTVIVACPPNLTDTLRLTVFREVKTPARFVPVKVTFRDTITAKLDSALRVANMELHAKYAQLQSEIAVSKSKLQEARRASGRALWHWIIVGLLAALIVYLVFVKKN